MFMEFDQATYEKIDAYIFESLTGKEKEDFEKEIESNSALKKEVELNKALKSSISGEGWHLLNTDTHKEQINKIVDQRRSNEYVEIVNNLEGIGNQYFEKQKQKPAKSRKLIYFIGVAASVLLLFTMGYFNAQPSTDSLYTEYSEWSNLPSLTLQSNDTSILAKGEALFNTKQYEKAIALFSKNTEESPTINPYVLSYLGASYLELEDYDNALNTFDKLLNSNTLDSSKGYWYKAMVYLKQGDQDKTIEILNLITKNEQHYNFNKAKQLLKKLH